MKISPIALTHIRLSYLYMFFLRVITLIESIGAEKLKIKPIFDNLFKPAVKRFDDSFKIIRKNASATTIKALDDSRDKITSGIKSSVKASLNDVDVEIVNAADKFKYLLAEFKGMSQKTTKEQTALTTNFIQSCRGEYAPLVAKLSLARRVDELERLNKEIYDEMVAHGEEKAKIAKLDTNKAKKDSIDGFRSICKQIELYMKTEGSANYEEFVRNLNVIIKEYGGSRSATTQSDSTNSLVEDNNSGGSGSEEDKYPNAREWSSDIDYQTCASGDIFYIIRNGVKEYYKLLDFGEVTTFEPGMDDGGIWEKLS